MIRITIQTTAYPPIPLKAFVDNLDDNNFDIHFTPIIDYEHKFNLPAGKYILSVSGMNGLADNDQIGTTKVFLNGTFSQKPSPDSPQQSSDAFFILGYQFEI